MKEPAEIPVIDVRPVLAAGGEPLEAIVNLAAATPPGAVFVDVAPYDPAPLRSLLAGGGFDATAQETAPGQWRVLFRRRASAQG